MGCDPFTAWAIACPQGICCPLLYSFNPCSYIGRRKEGICCQSQGSSLNLTKENLAQSQQMLLTAVDIIIQDHSFASFTVGAKSLQ